MQKKQRNKPKPQDIAKIRARFNAKCEEYKDKSLEELKEIYKTVKMSSTDRTALVEVVNMKLEQESLIKLKEDEVKKVEEGTSGEEE